MADPAASLASDAVTGSASATPESTESTEPASRAFIDLHCHTSASFDSLATGAAVARAAVQRGLTHLAVTDHDRIDAALRIRDIAPPALTVIVGEEIKTHDGDLIGLFLRELVPPGMTAVETIEAIREQGGLVGVPHPFDRWRGYGHKSGARLEDIADKIDWVEAHNARVIGGANGTAAEWLQAFNSRPRQQLANIEAADFAREHQLPGVAVSDAHTVLEVGVAYNIVDGDPGTPEGLLASLAKVDIVPGRATIYVRAWTPLAKIIQSIRGNGRRAAGPRVAE